MTEMHPSSLVPSTPLCPTGHLPLGDWQFQLQRFSCNVGDWRKRPRHLISPLEGEMSGRTEGGAKERKPIGLWIIVFLTMLLGLVPAAAAPIDDQFQAWLQNDLWPEAKAKGISKKTFDAAFIGVKPNLKLPDLVMPGEKPTTPEKQHQAEFGPPGAYFAEKTIRAVTSGGRTRESANARVLGLIEKRYGVPGEIVLAIWGRETGFGAAKMPYDAFEVLGTDAFMSTKKDFFRPEVLAALEIVEHGLAPVNAMKSSWAGALGQPQFMPTSFLKHAVDFEGSGRPDIWNSTPDVLASIANYLVHYGWVRGRGWGVEVTAVSYTHLDVDRWKVLTGARKFPIGRRWASGESTARRSRRAS